MNTAGGCSKLSGDFVFAKDGVRKQIRKKLEISSNMRQVIMRNSCQECFRSLVRDTSLPLRITLVYLKTTTAYVRSKLLNQWAIRAR